MSTRPAVLPTLAAVVLVMTLGVTLMSMPSRSAFAEGPSGQSIDQGLDDEIVLLRDSKLVIYDPYPVNGTSRCMVPQ